MSAFSLEPEAPAPLSLSVYELTPQNRMPRAQRCTSSARRKLTLTPAPQRRSPLCGDRCTATPRLQELRPARQGLAPALLRGTRRLGAARRSTARTGDGIGARRPCRRLLHSSASSARPNVDFYSGIIFRALGLPVAMFTPAFAVARTVGWAAHWNEMIADPRNPAFSSSPALHRTGRKGDHADRRSRDAPADRSANAQRLLGAQSNDRRERNGRSGVAIADLALPEPGSLALLLPALTLLLFCRRARIIGGRTGEWGPL
jgi:Citrate synthase, C-terminal domain